jgi:hypothetical protein
MISPRLQRDMAQRIQARIREVPASHVPFASRPRETTAIILEAVAEVRGLPSSMATRQTIAVETQLSSTGETS